MFNGDCPNILILLYEYYPRNYILLSFAVKKRHC